MNLGMDEELAQLVRARPSVREVPREVLREVLREVPSSIAKRFFILCKNLTIIMTLM